VFVVDAANPKRENWKEIIPQTDAVLESGAILDGKIFAQYEKDASSLLKLFALDGKPVSDIPMPTIGSVTGIGGKWNRREAFFGFHSFTVPPSVYQVDLVDAGGRREVGATVARVGANVEGGEAGAVTGATFGWSTAECLRWQTCAAARSLARTGIAPACWIKSKTSLTISSLPPNF